MDKKDKMGTNGDPKSRYYLEYIIIWKYRLNISVVWRYCNLEKEIATVGNESN